MTTLSGLALVLAAQTGPNLAFQDDTFVIQSSRVRHEVHLGSTETPVFALSHNDRWVVWDNRGLVVRDGEWVFATRLEEVATTPRLFSRDEIVANLARFESKERTRAAAGLVGHEFVGDTLYLEAQWRSKSGEVWNEALVRVDLSRRRPKPELLGRFPGRSAPDAPDRDTLLSGPGGLMSLRVVEKAWGAATWAPADDLAEPGIESEFKPVGENLLSYRWVREGRVLLFVERTLYGTSLVGRADVTTQTRAPLADIRGQVTLMSARPGIVRIADRTGFRLRSLETGAELHVAAASAEARSTPLGVLVWTPTANPAQAALYEPDRWRGVASWIRPRPTPPSSRKPAAQPARPPSRPRP